VPAGGKVAPEHERRVAQALDRAQDQSVLAPGDLAGDDGIDARVVVLGLKGGEGRVDLVGRGEDTGVDDL
jgi:hypothetical protein